MAIKLICIDMDATLLKDDKSYLREQFKHAALTLIDQGVIICIASGNIEHRLASYFDKDLLEELYLAADNGNYLTKNDQLIHAISVERADMEKIVAHLAERDGFHISVSTGDKAYVLKEDMSDKVRAKFSIYYDWEHVVEVDHFNSIPEEAPLCKIAIWTEQSLQANKQLAEKINQNYAKASSVTSGGSWMDVYHVEGGKGSAVNYLQDKYHIKMSETIAFGDSLNDASMMEESAFKVAVANADPELKALCNYQIPSNQDQAVVHLLSDLAGNLSTDLLKKYER